MKKTLLLSGLLLALTASMALAASPGGGINFAWGDCSAGSTLYLKTFACTSNTLTGVIAVGSFAPSIDQPDFVGIEVVVDLQASAGTLPAWWQFYNAGACRATGALSTSADFTGGPFNCADPWAGVAAGGIAAYQTTTTAPPVPNGLPYAARLKVAYALALASPVSMGVETYGFKATINGSKTVGTGACAGCLTPVQLVLNEIKSAGNATLARNTTPMLNTCLSWQSRDGTICAATPAQNSTWGQVKSLYR